PQDKNKERLLKEFLEKLASSDIKDIQDIIDLQQNIDNFIEALEMIS
ncbi:unnamed protein product, partial [marine sediment metagenome]